MKERVRKAKRRRNHFDFGIGKRSKESMPMNQRVRAPKKKAWETMLGKNIIRNSRTQRQMKNLWMTSGWTRRPGKLRERETQKGATNKAKKNSSKVATKVTMRTKNKRRNKPKGPQPKK